MRGSYFKAGVTSLLAFLGVQGEAKEKPNIILFMVDDMGWQDTSVPFWSQRTPLNDKYHTPAMEQLAQQGMKFTQAYACAVSSPSRASMITGMNAARHRVTNWTLVFNESTDGEDPKLSFPEWNVNGVQPVSGIPHSAHVTALPALLRQGGYTTIHCGKAHFGATKTPASDPATLGFDINIAGHAAGGLATYQGLKNYGNDENGAPLSVWATPGLKKYHGKDVNLTDALTREAIDAVDKSRSAGKPFFLYMAHYAVHIPLEPDNRFYQKYKDRGLDEREARYASMVEGMDRSLSDIMEYLKRTNQDKNTIIIFMSDNGGLAAHGRGGKPNVQNAPLSSGKGSAYEGGIRVPMIVKWPGQVKAGSQCGSYLMIEDFYPSILEMAGVKGASTVQHVDGVSFVPALKGKKINVNRPLFWHYPNCWGVNGPGIGASSSVRLGDFKLIYYHADQRFELFNVREDIGETNNLAATRPDKVKELAAVLGRYLRSADAQMPTIKASGKVVPWPDEVEK